MSNNTKSGLNLPSTKCFIKQLESCGDCNSDVPGKSWSMRSLNGDVVGVRVVWIQGKVTRVLDGGEVFHLHDGTATCTVSGLRTLNYGCPDISIGKYLMVIGEVIQCKPEVKIGATKIQDFGTNMSNESLWQYEVVESSTFLND